MKRLIYPVVLLALLAALAPTGCDLPGAITTGVPPAATTPGIEAGSPDGLSTVSLGSLPPEARTTLQLIKSGGPFPYSRDGAVFNNYEGLLPWYPTGYYHEYTVPTPGSPDRGARRIIAGKTGEYYYTGDHYAHFSVIRE